MASFQLTDRLYNRTILPGYTEFILISVANYHRPYERDRIHKRSFLLSLQVDGQWCFESIREKESKFIKTSVSILLCRYR